MDTRPCASHGRTRGPIVHRDLAATRDRAAGGLAQGAAVASIWPGERARKKKWICRRDIERVGQQLGGNMRFAFRHFPLTGIHPHALAAAAAAEAAALQGRFWDMHELLFHRQKALEDADLLRYAAQLGLDVAAFDRDRASSAVADRIRRDVDSGLASDQVLGTPTLFIDGVVHRGGYDPPALLAALAP